MTSAFAWFAGWVVLIAFLVFISRSRAGSAIVYYVLWLSIVLLLVTHYSEITSLFQQANITQGQS